MQRLHCAPWPNRAQSNFPQGEGLSRRPAASCHGTRSARGLPPTTSPHLNYKAADARNPKRTCRDASEGNPRRRKSGQAASFAWSGAAATRSVLSWRSALRWNKGCRLRVNYKSGVGALLQLDARLALHPFASLGHKLADLDTLLADRAPVNAAV